MNSSGKNVSQCARCGAELVPRFSSRFWLALLFIVLPISWSVTQYLCGVVLAHYFPTFLDWLEIVTLAVLVLISFTIYRATDWYKVKP